MTAYLERGVLFLLRNTPETTLQQMKDFLHGVPKNSTLRFDARHRLILQPPHTSMFYVAEPGQWLYSKHPSKGIYVFDADPEGNIIADPDTDYYHD